MTITIWEMLQRLIAQVSFWVIVAPWEQAIRVRAGRRKKRLGPGLHPKLPIIDAVYKQSIRRRSSKLQMQTVTTRDGRTLSVSGAVFYAIADLEKMYETLHHAEDTIRGLCEGAVAKHITACESATCTPDRIAIEAAATAAARPLRAGGNRDTADRLRPWCEPTAW